MRPKVRVQVVFPDMRCQWFISKRDDLHVLSPLRQRLATTVILSHSGWSEPGLIEVSLVLKYTPDVDEEGVLNLGSPAANTTDVDSSGYEANQSSKDNLVDGVINLCSPVQVCIMPKVIR
ncbi:Integrator complex subunit 4 [Desmophyllum pertusum]|uniref:Integrator complex subunit 4 n=1 Tax=Desmophyllum pertusum TaxID=174260 RepID=A0A9X0DCB1_9CNID|nr:Integrator complex subunit 4 [Desmophyllum pertusum]